MIETQQVEIWNLSRDGVVRCGAVDIFNIVGRLKSPGTVSGFSYRLNGGPELPIFFLADGGAPGRLRRPGDFNIDTIGLADLEPDNVLRLRIARRDGAEHREEIRFRTSPFGEIEPCFSLDLGGADSAEQVGQVVEGPWRVGTDPRGRRCLEVAPEDAGYDRIILFGRKDWTTGYEVRARLSITRITGHHNVGIVFKWNPHERGDGTRLPTTWSTGLGYYCSYGKRAGLRIRFGVEVHLDQKGRKQGEYLLAHGPLASRWRATINRLKDRTGIDRSATELRLDRDYAFRLRVAPERYALTTWEADKAEPAPQLVVDDPIDRLPRGAVGILAYQVGVRLYEFEVRPLSGSPA